MKQINGGVLVKVPNTTLDVASEVTDKDGNKITIFRDTSYRPNHWARINGTVISQPISLNKTPVYAVYQGHPRPRRGYDSMQIARQLRDLPEQFHYRIKDKYACYPTREDTVYSNEAEINLQKGDEIWFHFHSLAGKNWRSYDPIQKMHVFRINYMDIFCAVRDGEIIPLNGHVLVKPGFEEGYEEGDFDGQKRSFKKQGEIVTEIGVQKKRNTGVLSKIGSPVGYNTRYSLKEGDEVKFTLDSKFENEILGETYYVMQQWDIFAANDQPVGDYIKVKPSGIYTSHLKVNPDIYGINDVDAVLKGVGEPSTGKVINKGELVENLYKDDFVLFENKSQFFIREGETVYMREGDVMAKINQNTRQYFNNFKPKKIHLQS